VLTWRYEIVETEIVTVRRITITKAEIVHKTTKRMDPDQTKAMAPDQNLNDLRGGYKPDDGKADSIPNIDWVGGPDGRGELLLTFF
jgi:hypothetical protein